MQLLPLTCREVEKLKHKWVWFAGIVVSVLVSWPVTAQEWTRFRGPNGSGNSAATTIPTAWTDADYRWRVDLPGVGHSSPVLWGNLLVVTSGLEESGTRLVLGLDATTGKQLWQADFLGGVTRKHKLNSLASATPALDDQHVYTCWATPEAFVVTALDHQGRQVWQTDLGEFKGGHGDGVSPIVHDDLVIVPKQHEGESEIIALDRSTGNVRWRAPRKSRSTWSTPCVFTNAQGAAELIVVSYTHGITSLDPGTGTVNWELDVFDKGHVESSISSPIVTQDLILGGSGWLSVRQEVIAVRPEYGNQTPQAEQVYCIDRGAPLCTTPLVVDDLLFLWADEGIVTCADASTGKVHWRQRVGGTYYASPVSARGHVYNVSADGVVVVLAADKEFRVVSRQELGESSHSTLAIAQGTMYLRTFSKLFALSGVPASSSEN